MIPPETIERVIDSVRISDVVSREIKLRRSGQAWKGLCKFHQERTPSFTCDDQRGTFHCFGCSEHGNVIDFVRKAYGWSFVEAIEALAKEAGIEIARSPEERQAEARKLSDLQVIDRVRLWFQSQLQRCTDALGYLKQRGVSNDAISAYGIGFAPAHTAIPVQALGGRPDDGVLSRTGLVVAETGAPYFKGRITFPVRDRRGRTLGFGGRALKDLPKYLNTPETEFFHKRDLLYGVDLAPHDQPLYVVEGYLDVIACHHFGYSAVAPMGTALSETQLKNLWRLSDRPIIAFDGDEAGRKATRRALELAFKHLEPGLTLQTVKLPQGRDPGSYLVPGTGDGFKRILGRPHGLAEAFWEESTLGLTFGGPDKLAKLESDMLSVLYTIPNRQLREKYVWDCRQRVRTLSRPRPQIRANGHSFHSTNPTKRLLQHPDGMTIKQALEIAHSQDPHDALDEARTVLLGVGLWPINVSISSSPKESD